MRKLILLVGLVAVVGCASFVNTSQKSLYAAATLADGGMKTYATYWKWQTNRLGATTALIAQRDQVMIISAQIGSSISLAQKTLDDYSNNVGTNTATKEVVQALVQTAIQDAGALVNQITTVTGDPSWATTVH